MSGCEERNAYILGTERAELHRLGIQHQVWAGEARRAWDLARFGPGQTILDLGCGPGFCTRDLAYLVGEHGCVIGVDRSPSFIAFVERIAALHGLDLELLCADFEQMDLRPDSLDGVFCRWALAWVADPFSVLQGCVRALRPGGRFVAHEYVDWSVFQTEPVLPALRKGIAAALQSFRNSEGDIDIGRHLPRMLDELGLRIESTRPLAKLAKPGELAWQWPKTFLEIYLPKLAEPGLLSPDDAKAAIEQLHALETRPGAMIVCPHVIEVIASKPL